MEDQRSNINREKGNEIKSNCGKCYLGDDVRCENCPYRGLPKMIINEIIKIVNKQDL